MIDSEKPVKADILKADTWWFHIFRDLISSGEFAKIPASAVKAYLALKSHVHISSGVAQVSLKTLTFETGTSRETVKRAISTLVQLGHIESSQTAGRVNSYTFLEHFNIRNSDDHLIGVASFSYKGSTAGIIQKDLIDTLKKGKIDFSSKHICYKPNKENQTILDNSPSHSIDISKLPSSLQKKLGPHLYRASTNTE